MRSFPPDSFLAECEPFVRRLISAQPELGMTELGVNGKFIYLVRHTIASSDLEIHEQLAQRLLDSGYPDAFASSFTKLNECLAPHVGHKLLRCGIWWSGVRHELYIDERDASVVHQSNSTHPDPDDIDTESDNKSVNQSGESGGI